MSKIIKNSLVALCLCLLPIDVWAKTQVKEVFAIYDKPKYEQSFANFDYVNPNAPKGGKITLPAYGTFDSFNPFIFFFFSFPEAAELSLESLGFVSPDDPMSVYPLIAEKFEVPEDKSFIGFFINPKAQFANGEKITADDVIFSFNALIEKGAPLYKIYYADVDKAEKVADNHVRFYFKKGTQNRELPLILSQFKIFSKKDFEDKDFATPSLIPPVGSGPYKVDGFEVNKYVNLKRNPDYWGKDIPTRKGFYNFDSIRYEFYQDTTVTLQALFSGNIDARDEYIAKIWVSGYDNKLVKDGKIIKEEIQHHNPATLQFFGFNTRLEKFSDRRVREAIALAFNFDWANEKLFYNQYSRIYSLFSNTDLAASGLPQGKEKHILQKYQDDLPDEIFTSPFSLPDNSSPQKLRQNLKKAVKLLNEAGYDFVDGKMVNLETKEPLEIEILSNSANGATFTRVMLPFIENLRKIGIKLNFRNLEVNVFKNRLDNFDFEMAILSFRLSNLPGNEQKELWGSASADVKGSFNVLGIKNPAVDGVIEQIIKANDQETYLSAVKALDRIIMNEHYFIPNWYSPHDRIAYNNKLAHPETEVKVGADIHTWWVKEK